MQVRAEVVAELRVAQRVVDRCFQVTQFLAGIVTAAVENVSIEIALPHQLAKRIGELNLAARSAFGLREDRKNLRRQNVATDDRVLRRRFDFRFLDHVAHAEAPVREHVACHDSVSRSLIGRNFHQRDDWTSRLFEHATHLQETRLVGEDHIIRKYHGKRLIADRALRHQHCVSEALRFLLADGDEVDHLADTFHFGKKIHLAALAEVTFQADGAVEVVEDRVLPLGSDDDQLVHSGVASFFDPILKNGLIDERQHLLRNDLGGREESGPETRAGKDTCPEWAHRGRRIHEAYGLLRPIVVKLTWIRVGMRKSLIFLVVLLLAVPASAQWRRGGIFGADVRALIADPNDPDTLYLGTSGGEVYVSTDAAKSWTTPRNGIPFPGHVVDNLVLDRNGRVWAAAWGLWGGGVVAMSEDRGKTWTRRDAGLEDVSIRAIAIDPNDATFVLVGGLDGVYRSVDAGVTWTKLSPHENVESLAIDPRTRDTIYVGTWRQGWRSDDGGKLWTHINKGMVLDTDMFEITIDPENPDNVWVSTCGWVYNSVNRGDEWTRYRDGFNNRRIHDVELDACERDTVYAGSVAGLYRSDDRGKTWYTVSNEDLVINSVVLHPQRPERVILGIEGDGVYVSHDRAKTFTRSSEGLHNVRITTIIADPHVKNRVFASVAFGGTSSGIYRSDDAGRTWSRVSETKIPEVLSLVIAPEENADPKFLAGTEKGFFYSNDAKEWTQAPPSSFPIRVNRVLRYNSFRSFAATAEGVFTTRDSGKTWYRLAGADDRTIDIATGFHNGNRALFALTATGIAVFDGDRWSTVPGAPTKGRTIAMRTVEGKQYIFVAGATGVRAGRIDYDGSWFNADAPDAQYASVYGSTQSTDHLLFLTSRQQREILVGTPQQTDWLELVLPTANTEVTAIAPDPHGDRFYVGTVGEGVFVYEGKTQKYVRKTTGAAIAAGGAE